MGYRLLDLFCGRWGWSRAFAARGWECVGMDLVVPPEIPQGCKFICQDILGISDWFLSEGKLSPFDFITVSSPCDNFSLFQIRNFHPDPPYPKLGIKLFNHARSLCEAS